jgi:hypothetical protein
MRVCRRSSPNKWTIATGSKSLASLLTERFWLSRSPLFHRLFRWSATCGDGISNRQFRVVLGIPLIASLLLQPCDDFFRLATPCQPTMDFIPVSLTFRQTISRSILSNRFSKHTRLAAACARARDASRRRRGQLRQRRPERPVADHVITLVSTTSQNLQPRFSPQDTADPRRLRFRRRRPDRRPSSNSLP